MRLTLAAALIAVLATPADAGFRSYYSASGAYVGGSITRNGHTTFTDAGGRYVGSSGGGDIRYSYAYTVVPFFLAVGCSA